MSGLAGFKYLRRRRILALVLVQTLASTLFSITAFSLVGFYRGFTAYMGEAEDVVVLYDRKSSTPFTGLVPAYLAERIGSINGVLAASPEVLAPCVVKGRPVFLRGVIPEEFAKLTGVVVREGEMLRLDDVNSIIVGERLAKALNLKPGEKVLVLGVLKDQYLELQVKGVYKSNSMLDDEALAPLYVAQWLRGVDYGYVTLIRFKVDRDAVSPAQIFEEVAKEALKPASGQGGRAPSPPVSQPAVPRAVAHLALERIGVEEAEKFMKSYVERYGLTREALLTLSVVVFLFSGMSIAAAFKNLVSQHRGEISVLRSIGAPEKSIRRDIFVKLLPWVLLSSSMGVAIAAVVMSFIHENGYLQVLSHTVQFQPDPAVIAVNFALPLLLVALSVARVELGCESPPTQP